MAETPSRYALQIDDGGKTTGMLALPNRWSEAVEPVATALPEPVGIRDPLGPSTAHAVD